VLLPLYEPLLAVVALSTYHGPLLYVRCHVPNLTKQNATALAKLRSNSAITGPVEISGLKVA
jgi:hypothetical protein